MYSKILSVSAVNNYIKKVIESDFILKNSKVKGELSNVKIHSSGHIYFSLKDNLSKINCVMFRSLTSNLKFTPKDGMNVVISGNISVYEKEGVYQLYCTEMTIEGEGELYLAFEKLKLKLDKEGFFDPAKKKPIPQYAKKIGVVTSITGAAIRDIIKVGTHRNRNVDILIYPSLVQGIYAVDEIVEGIRELNKIEDVELIILARGGGSIEELWCFNDEKVARSIYESHKPIITGIGHETDFTIADFVADYRGATPSQAAELAVYDRSKVLNILQHYRSNLERTLTRRINDEFMYLDKLQGSLKLNRPSNYILRETTKIENYKYRLNMLVNSNMMKYKNSLDILNEKISSNNPYNILNKGYGIVRDKKNNNISSIKQLIDKKTISIQLKDGKANLNIELLEE